MFIGYDYYRICVILYRVFNLFFFCDLFIFTCNVWD